MADDHITILQDCAGYEDASEQSNERFRFRAGTVLRLLSEHDERLFFLVAYRRRQAYVPKQYATVAEQGAVATAVTDDDEQDEDYYYDDDDLDEAVGGVTRRYPALQTISGVFRLLGWLTIVLGTIGAILSAVAIGSADDGSGVAAVALLIGGLIAAAASGILLIALADLILVAIDIERNTRAMASAE